MKRLFLYLLYSLFSLTLLLYLMPKTQLYYLLEEHLATKEVIISNERIKENFSSLVLKDFDIYYKKQFVLNVSELQSSYDFMTPLDIHIDAFGEFGKLYANVDLINRKIIIALKASSLMKRKHAELLSAMTLTKGVYTYEYKY